MKGRVNGFGLVLAGLFVFYLYMLLKIILFKFGDVNMFFLGRQLLRGAEDPSGAVGRLLAGNFTPFESIRQNLHRLSSPHDFANLVGNVAIFAPLGLFLRLLTGVGVRGAVALSLGVSLALELAEAVFAMGTFDVDDLLLNGFGGLLGFALTGAVLRLRGPLAMPVAAGGEAVQGASK